jgi:chromosome segregation protein
MFTKTRTGMSGGSVGLFEGKRIGRAKNLEKLSKEINSGETLIVKLKNSIAEEEIKLKDLIDSSQKDLLQESQQEINRLSNEYTSVKTKQEQYLAFIENSLNRKQDIEQKIVSIG